MTYPRCFQPWICKSFRVAPMQAILKFRYVIESTKTTNNTTRKPGFQLSGDNGEQMEEH